MLLSTQIRCMDEGLGLTLISDGIKSMGYVSFLRENSVSNFLL